MGGSAPISGFHSMMESPLPESRVMPPSSTITKIIAAQTNSQTATARSCPSRDWAPDSASVREVKAWVIAAGR